MKQNIVFILVFCIFGNHCQSENTFGIEKEEHSCNCKLNFNELTVRNHPIYLVPNSNTMIYPNFNYSYLIMETGQPIELRCSRSGYVVENLPFKVDKIVLYCLYDYTFVLENKNLDIRKIQCIQPIRPRTRLTYIKCGENGRKIDVGFFLSGNLFVHSYTVCFNSNKQITESVYCPHLAVSNLRKHIRGSYFNVFKDHFQNNTLEIFHYYYPAVYEKAFARQLGHNLTESDFFHNGLYKVKKHFLHDGTNAYYEFEQSATQYYINNVAHFSKCAWTLVKIAIKSYSMKRKAVVQLYAGTYGQLHLQHKNNTLVPIYLDYIKQRIPIPAIIWKVFYDPQRFAGLAVIGINNYFECGKYIPLCKDISSELPWMNAAAKSCMYACEVKDWFNVVKTAFPYLIVRRILGADMGINRNVTARDKDSKKRQRQPRGNTTAGEAPLNRIIPNNVSEKQQNG